MPSVIECFLLEPTGEALEALRRYAGVPDGRRLCEPFGYHNASAVLGRIAYPLSEHSGAGMHANDHSDVRWPKSCHCGYLFSDKDAWQYNIDRLYSRSDTGELVTLDDAPAGAMWFAPWYESHIKGPDGRCLVVKTPGGEWIVDSIASNSKTPWTRSGVPPRVTAAPSIGIGVGPNGGYKYHGWLRDGRLVEC